MAKSASAADDYFAGGRALTWYVVAGSLMLTNLSTEQLVGLNGAIFKDGCLAGCAWETFAALAMCATACFFLPRYMRSGLSTTTGFLGERFDLLTRTLVSMVFLIYYCVGLCPIVLYTGSLALRNIFELDEVPFWVVSTGIGIVGACYAIFGGLKAVAISDCLNGIGLLVVGLWVPYAALQKIGGLSNLFEESPSFLRPMVTESEIFDNDKASRSLGAPSVPWDVTLTGLMLQNLYYWSTNQLIVQRALGARSLAEGQKGVLFAASMKVVGFSFLCMPGIIGAVMVKNGVVVDGKPFTVDKSDEIYPLLVRTVMPDWSLGFFAAVLLGSILSTFNSALNSASTLFGLELYKVYVNREATEERVVQVSTFFGASLAVGAIIIAPNLEGVESIFDLLQRIKTLASLPIITTFLVGICTVLPDAFAAKVGFVVGALIYGVGQFLPEPHYLHVFFLCFLISLATMMVAAYVPCVRTCFRQEAKPIPFVEKPAAVVSMVHWSATYPVVGAIVSLVVLLTVSLQIGSIWLFSCFWALWALATITLMALPSRGFVQELPKETSKEQEPEKQDDLGKADGAEIGKQVPDIEVDI
jgi:SSS family solute:Na+ symporter